MYPRRPSDQFEPAERLSTTTLNIHQDEMPPPGEPEGLHPTLNHRSSRARLSRRESLASALQEWATLERHFSREPGATEQINEDTDDEDFYDARDHFDAVSQYSERPAAPKRYSTRSVHSKRWSTRPQSIRQAPEKRWSSWTATTGTTGSGESDEEDEEVAAPLPPKKRTWAQKLNPLKTKKIPPIPDERQPSHEPKAGWFALLTFQWVSPLMTTGYNRPLELNDIWKVNPSRGVEPMKEKFMANLQNRKKRVNRFSPIAMALYDTFKTDFWVGGICQLVAAILQVMAPFTMKYLIEFAAKAFFAKFGFIPKPPLAHGIGLVLGITSMQIIQSGCMNHFIYRGMLVGGQCRGVLISVIFDKAMKLSGRAKAGGYVPKGEIPAFKPGSKQEKAYYKKKLDQEKKSDAKQGWGNGRIVNLMSVDTYRVDLACGMGHMIWTAPIQVTLTLVLLLINLTYNCLPGFGFIMLCTPLLAISVKSMASRRKGVNLITDMRVSLTQEIIASVRFVKFFGWETSFLERVASIRADEISKISRLLSIRNAIIAVGMSLPIFASMLAFITYSQQHPTLPPAEIFSSLALFNALRVPLNLIPMVIGQVVDAYTSLHRIEDFLNAEEAQDDADWEPRAKQAITIRNADFTWERAASQQSDDAANEPPPKTPDQIKQEKKDAKRKQKDEKEIAKQVSRESIEALPIIPGSPSSGSFEDEEQPFQIKDVNLTVGREELIAVIGSVGSGKSSLLAALAGDMRKTHGNVTFGANRAFCPQYAWIQNATVKENITFGKEFDQKWYDQVIDACALRPDLEMLPDGDQTEIGERGITVSGGQKQRLNIARAIYFNSEIVLMDDPLSAVDAHVGRHIMDNAICGLLKGKCRVLATHQLHVLHRVDRIVWLKEGAIYKIATFPELMADDDEFQELMKTTAAEERKDDQEHANEDEIEEEKKDAVKKKKTRKPGKSLMQLEERAVNNVGWGVYHAYIKASGSMWNAVIAATLLVVANGANVMTSLWLSYWTSNKWNLSEGTYIGGYAAFGVLQAFLNFAFSTSLTHFGTSASRVMMDRAMYRVLRAPMSFFDTTPLGRITNRFSKDVDTMDNSLTDSMRMFFITMGTIIAVFCLILAYYYYFIVALVPLTIFFVVASAYYRASARELKRHESVLRSSVFARFSEAINGSSTIKAYGVEKHFANQVSKAVDAVDGAYFLTFANQRWLAFRLDGIGNALVFVLGILVVTDRFNIDPSIGGLVLSYILSIVQLIQFVVRQLAEFENNMNSTERLHYYGTCLDEEAALTVGKVRPSWPEKGEIVFDNVQMRYRDGLPLVLKGLDMQVRAGERIGVVGRTGAGKSTIMTTLFRLTELSGGSITIDGVDIAKIGLRDLRSKLAIIPQDPTLFKGTIRGNLDPFHEHTDTELWYALRQADLVGDEQSIDDDGGRIHLETKVEDEGLNFSLGQRQLLALARALVRNSQIIVCDEATSSVDFETDQKIQRTIVRGFAGKTLLCIAHRLKTIIGYDRILVMDQGNVAELDAPLVLYDNGGIFRSMCDRSGIRREDFFESAQARLVAEEEGRREEEEEAESVATPDKAYFPKKEW